jgi:hypothetical protein
VGIIGSSERDIGCNYTGDGKTLTGMEQNGHYDNIAQSAGKTMAKMRCFEGENHVRVKYSMADHSSGIK